MSSHCRFLHDLPVRALSALLLGATLANGAAAQAQPAAAGYPAAAVRFLDGELPQMEAAVAARDRDYFEHAMGRTVDFSGTWGFRTRANPALAPYASCTEAVSDFTIVGLCRIAPSLDGCDPVLATRFDSNLRHCRDLAAGR